jgi:asparagine synthase (glutamine-hydrolysing)
MCGIAGIVDFTTAENKTAILKKMMDSLRHRGPDSSGIFSNEHVGLAHTRLSIIDLKGGSQPIHNENKTIWIIFNGEIFNYPELRKDLLSKGHEFYTQTDTEVLVHLYEEYNIDMFKYLNGQFAFAIWDSLKNEILLARDRVGIIPLFYFFDNKKLLFGSEIKAILADDKIPRNLNLKALSSIFTCWSPVGAQSVFQDILQLPPGNYLKFSKKGFSIQRYCDLPFGKVYPNENTTESDLVEELNQLLIDATRIRLRADVSVGAYLSGGLDSTYTSAIVKANFNNKLTTFSIGFSDKNFDESLFQNLAVAELKTDHKLFFCSHQDIGQIFPEVIWHTETPILRTSPAPLMLLSKLVKDNGFKVVLTGEGADELFAGYNIFKEDKIRRFWAKRPESKIRPLLLKKLYPYIFSDKNKRTEFFLRQFFKKGMVDTASPIYSHLLRWENTSQLKTFFSKDALSQMPDLKKFIDEFTKSLPAGFMVSPPLSRAQYIENKIFLSNYLLSSQGDRMSMANSIEGRYPFLDHRVIEFAAKIPPYLRLNGLTEKYILKKAAGTLVPKEIVNRAKQPYRAPISKAFIGDSQPEYVSELLSERKIRDFGYFDHKKINTLMKKCLLNNGMLLSERENMALVGILSTQLVHNHFISK